MVSAKHITTLALLLAASGCVAAVEVEDERSTIAGTDIELEGADAALCRVDRDLDPRRSLAVTEEIILRRFSLERVLDKLLHDAASSQSAGELFQRLWDTQNPGAFARFEGPHCDDTLDAALAPVINGFPYTCRAAPAEGVQAECDPLRDPACSYQPIGLFNRLDLAPEDGSHCGEYRVVFAKEAGLSDPRNRSFLIFEAVMPNPAPWLGLAGCRPLATFWAELSRIDDLEQRARRLEQLYFRGLGHGFDAVIDVRHFGANPRGLGQVRTNQFMQAQITPRVWSLREHKLERSCEEQRTGWRRSQKCGLRFRPVTDKTNPYGPLFAPSGNEPQRSAFQALFLSQVEALTASDPMAIRLAVPDRYNSAQSQASGSTESDLLFNYDNGGTLEGQLAGKLEELDSELEPIDLIARAQTQTCAGCHHFSNGRDLGGGVTWPSSLGFTHVGEETEVVDGVTRHVLSSALTTLFLPHRMRVLQSVLGGRRGPRGGERPWHFHH